MQGAQVLKNGLGGGLPPAIMAAEGKVITSPYLCSPAEIRAIVDGDDRRAALYRKLVAAVSALLRRHSADKALVIVGGSFCEPSAVPNDLDALVRVYPSREPADFRLLRMNKDELEIRVVLGSDPRADLEMIRYTNFLSVKKSDLSMRGVIAFIIGGNDVE